MSLSASAFRFAKCHVNELALHGNRKVCLELALTTTEERNVCFQLLAVLKNFKQRLLSAKSAVPKVEDLARAPKKEGVLTNFTNTEKERCTQHRCRGEAKGGIKSQRKVVGKKDTQLLQKPFCLSSPIYRSQHRYQNLTPRLHLLWRPHIRKFGSCAPLTLATKR